MRSSSFGSANLIPRIFCRRNRPKWWKKDERFDQEIAQKFRPQIESALEAPPKEWLHHPQGRLSVILLLDQMTRNIFRGTKRMYEGDQATLSLVKEGLKRQHDHALKRHPRTFFYLPLMHSEALEDQDQCVHLFEQMIAESPPTCRPPKSESRSRLRPPRHRPAVGTLPPPKSDPGARIDSRRTRIPKAARKCVLNHTYIGVIGK